jgi:AraC-like DNA-binding protein
MRQLLHDDSVRPGDPGELEHPCAFGDQALRPRRVVAAGDGFEVLDVRCAAGPGWSEPEFSDGYTVVFVRRGSFLRRTDGREHLMDATASYVEFPGGEQQIAHGEVVGDACTAIRLSDELVDALGRPEPARFDRPMPTPIDVALTVQLVTRQVLSADPWALGETIARVAGAAFSGAAPRSHRARPSTGAFHARLVNQAREILSAQPATSLVELAGRLFVSPHHLSRIFHVRTGMTLSAYRNEIRARQALDRLAEGEPSLIRLANDLGFADHAHLTRVVRTVTGQPPVTLRRLLVQA